MFEFFHHQSAADSKVEDASAKLSAAANAKPASEKPAVEKTADEKAAAAKPMNDIQKHVAAFDTNHDGIVTRSELALGFRAIGYEPRTARFKAMMAQQKFGSVIADLKPDSHGLYNSEGNLDTKRVDALFQGKDTLSKQDVEHYLDARNIHSIARGFIKGQFDSAFQSVRRDFVTRNEFVRIMNGDLMKEKIEAYRKKK